MSETVRALTLAAGEGEGAPLLLDEPLSFWGGLDVKTGIVIDRWHPQHGRCVAGRVLMMPSGRGSSSGSAALAEALRLGVGPAAVLLLQRDGIVIVGALVATELYALACPVALLRPEDWQSAAMAKRLTLRATETGADLTLLGRRARSEPKPQ